MSMIMRKPNLTHKFALCDTFVMLWIWLWLWLHLQRQLCWPCDNLLSHYISPNTYHKVNITVFIRYHSCNWIHNLTNFSHMRKVSVRLGFAHNCTHNHTCISTYISNITHLITNSSTNSMCIYKWIQCNFLS